MSSLPFKKYYTTSLSNIAKKKDFLKRAKKKLDFHQAFKSIKMVDS